MNTAQERIDTIVRNIMSGDNKCGTLAHAATSGDSEYFRRAAAPVVKIYEEEAAQLRADRDYQSRDAELKRQALESVISNVPDLPAPVKAIMARAMPNHPLLKGI